MVERSGWGASRPLVLVHGGAGARDLDREPLTQGCERAATAGHRVLAAGGTALDAVVAAVVVLEDDPWFNAGTGAALREDASVSLDASVMDGTGLRAGGVAALPPFRNPVRVARAVLDEGRHVLYAGEEAARWAVAAGFDRLGPDDLVTDRARRLLAQHRAGAAATPPLGGLDTPPLGGLDTVGAVAVDPAGGVAAATSTGGLVGARPGRVGDSPVPGAGCFADGALGACSATGEGEAILRAVLAFDAVSRLGLAPDPQAAAAAAIARLGSLVGGAGGLIVVTPSGAVGLARNTPTMPWALADPGGVRYGW
jgi:beta-aspartyl-peptidase (threonine type)